MFRRKILVLALVASFSFSVLVVPATAAPTAQQVPGVVSAALSWVLQALGLDAADTTPAKSRADAPPPANGPDDGTSSLTTDDESAEGPGNEMGIFPDPGG